MTLALSYGSDPTDTSILKQVTQADMDATIMALSPRMWLDPTNPAYYTPASGKYNALTDRSGNGFNALQATTANQPVLTAAGFGTIAGVGRDAMTFDGATARTMPTAGNVFDGTSTWTIAQMVKISAGYTGGVGNAWNALAGYLQAGHYNAANMQGPGAEYLSMPVAGVQGLLIYAVNAANAAPFNWYLEFAGVIGGGVQASSAFQFASTTGISIGGSAGGNTFNGNIADTMVFKGYLPSDAAKMKTLRDFFTFKFR